MKTGAYFVFLPVAKVPQSLLLSMTYLCKRLRKPPSGADFIVMVMSGALY